MKSAENPDRSTHRAETISPDGDTSLDCSHPSIDEPPPLGRTRRIVRSTIGAIGLTLTLFFGCCIAFTTTCTATGTLLLVAGMEAIWALSVVVGLLAAWYTVFLLLHWARKPVPKE